jgi:hypothetical protein
MTEATEDYRGYRIVVVPVKDHEDLWDFEYQLTRLDGGTAEPRKRSQTAGGHISPEIALLAGLEVARTEVDNLLALEHARTQ